MQGGGLYMRLKITLATGPHIVAHEVDRGTRRYALPPPPPETLRGARGAQIAGQACIVGERF
jgi:hypothetical protein